MKNRPWRLAALLLACAVLAACGNSATRSAGSGGKDANGLSVVKIGSEKVTSDAGIFLADQIGYFKKAGIKVEYQRLSDAPTITNALATGHLDVAGASLAPGVFTAANQHLDIKIVGDKQSIRPGVSATRFAVRPQYSRGGIGQTLKALRGKKIAVHSKLSVQLYMLSNLLHRYGMKLDDFDIVPVASPDQVGALKSGSVDAAVMLEPFYTQGVEAGIVKPASDLTEGTPRSGQVLTGLLYGKRFIDDHKLGNAFMTAYMQGVRTYNDAMFHGGDTAQAEDTAQAKNTTAAGPAESKDKVVGIIAKQADVPVDLVRKTKPSGLDPDQRLDTAYLDRLQHFYVSQHVLDKTTNVRDLADTSFADAARKKLGVYRAP
ncbi:ABC transporter substrate-binding protein [Streptomyces sp. NPDC050560]|uniref:ABC transporter substrate-binding protein n=1 Tax=Streptomyces sp. NPDC050560 TaxID=3365630 RepID=UPI0037B0C673